MTGATPANFAASGSRRCSNNNIVNIHEVYSSYDSEQTNKETPCEHNSVQKYTAVFTLVTNFNLRRIVILA